MSGSSNQPRQELAQIWSITVPAPMDDRQTVSTALNINTELPVGVRYPGLCVWVDDEKTFYVFKDGTADSDFVELRSLLNNSTSNMTLAVSYEYGTTQPANSNIQLAHGLSSSDISVTMFEQNQAILLDYEITDKHVITIKPNIDLQALKVVLYATGSSMYSPSSLVTVNDKPEHKELLRNITGSSSYTVNADSVITKIIYKSVSGSPVVSCGLVSAGTDITDNESLTSDENVVSAVNKSYNIDKSLFFTVSGGVIDIIVFTNEQLYI